MENGYIVLSASDVAVGGTLNPDAAGNQKFAINAMAVSGTVDASTLGTLRAYLVDGTEVLQRMGQVTIEEPAPSPRITTLTVGGNSIIAPGTATIIDENKQLAANIINSDLLTSGYIVLSATNVSEGGTLNPDASGNQKFAANSASISGTVSATTTGKLHAYLVDGTTVLQKCGDVQIVAPQARITAFSINSEDALLPTERIEITGGALNAVYSAQNLERISNPKIILSETLNARIGDDVVKISKHSISNGNNLTFTESGLLDGVYQYYLVEMASSADDHGIVVQVMGQVTQGVASDWENVTLQGSAWNQNQINIEAPVTSTGTYNGGGSATGVALVKKNTKPTVGQTEDNTVGYVAFSGNNFSLNTSLIDNTSKYWLVACHYDEGFENYRVDAVYDYSFNTLNEG